jgi:CRP-like cAMP-binding protein
MAHEHRIRSVALSIIQESRFFSGFSQAGRADLAARARIKALAPGETVFLLGESGKCLVVLLEGRLRVSIASSDGRELVLALVEPGEILGEIAVLDGRERTATVTAQGAGAVAFIDRHDLITLLEREPPAWLAIVELLCARLRSTDQQIVEIALLDLPVRLASTLLRLSPAQHAHAAAGQRIAISQRELGELVGASREAVNKCFAGWQRRGIVQIDGGHIVLANERALRSIAESK